MPALNPLRLAPAAGTAGQHRDNTGTTTPGQQHRGAPPAPEPLPLAGGAGDVVILGVDVPHVAAVEPGRQQQQQQQGRGRQPAQRRHARGAASQRRVPG